MPLTAFLTHLRPCDEHAARRELFRDGYTMPDGEIVQAYEYIARNRADMRVRRGWIEMRDGRSLRGKWLVRFLEDERPS